jgi:hypothetical protein
VAYCWGSNERGQLGVDAVMDRCVRFVLVTQVSLYMQERFFRCSEAPTLVSSTLHFASITAAGDRTCGVATDGSAYCWGENSPNVISGTAATDAVVRTPTAVSGGIQFKTLDAAAAQTCGVSASDTAYCWGVNLYASLGDGTEQDRRGPVQVSGGLTWRVIRAGRTGCGLATDGATYCWGADAGGAAGVNPQGAQLCAGQACVKTPTRLNPDPGFSDVYVGGAEVNCGLASSKAYCWGGARGPSPTVVDGFDFKNLTGGPCGFTADNLVYCWSVSRYPAFPSSPTLMADFPLSQFGVGAFHRCGIDMDGIVRCWDTTALRPPDRLSFTFFWVEEFYRIVEGTTTPKRVFGQP